MQVTLASVLIYFFNCLLQCEIRNPKYTKRNAVARASDHCIGRNATLHLRFFHIISQTAWFLGGWGWGWGGGGGGGNSNIKCEL